jgi:aspartate/methionine/tyrosine aminotransferase
MKVNHSPVNYSSIVEIGEKVSKLESETNDVYLKLHRGVMDVHLIDVNSFMKEFDYNQKSIIHYGNNDGDPQLINVIKNKFGLDEHNVIITPGGMAALDLLINSLSDSDFWVPKYHWGSWNKILKIHNKNILQFDDFKLSEFRPENGVVMLCFPSNPTGWIPDLVELEEFIQYTNSKGITVILDIPYFYLFNEENHPINNLFTDNVIVVSSFSKSLGLSGFRVGYVATKNAELQKSMRVRSLYKYNSISNVPQKIILKMLTSIEGNRSLSEYCELTKSHISKNIQYLKERNFLFSEYPSDPIGPFAIVNINFDELLLNKISSVPLKKFSLDKTISNDYSRISLAVNSDLFKKYFDLIN